MNAKNKGASLVEDILSHARSIYPLIGRAVTDQPAIWSSVSRASTIGSSAGSTDMATAPRLKKSGSIVEPPQSMLGNSSSQPKEMI